MLSIALYILAALFLLVGVSAQTTFDPNGADGALVASGFGFGFMFLALGRMHSVLKDIRENMGRG